MGKTYVSNWRKLAHRQQSISQVQRFMTAQGLLDGVIPTSLAFMHGYVKRDGIKGLWHLDKYRRLWRREGLHERKVDKMLMRKLSDMGYRSYSDYLLSEYWNNFKLRFFSKNKDRCFVCGRSHCQLHHITYERLGCELFEDVVALCAECHVKVHNLVKNQRIRLNEAHHMVKPPKVKSEYVSNWRKLLNKSKHQKVSELQRLLQLAGLLKGNQITNKAFDLGYARKKGNQIQWHKGRCVTMLKDGNCGRRVNKCKRSR